MLHFGQTSWLLLSSGAFCGFWQKSQLDEWLSLRVKENVETVLLYPWLTCQVNIFNWIALGYYYNIFITWNFLWNCRWYSYTELPCDFQFTVTSTIILTLCCKIFKVCLTILGLIFRIMFKFIVAETNRKILNIFVVVI